MSFFFSKMGKTFRALELYSGIGGMHYAIQEMDIPFDVVAAVDINTTANEIYQYNFPEVKLINKCIESISIQEWDKLQFNMLLMSPPCQPFCRVGKQQDIGDERSKSFLALLEVLPRLAVPPSYILVENVKGFDTSESRTRLLAVLQTMEYSVQEFLLSPVQFGIPNSRLRYYLIAKKKPLSFNFETKDHIRDDIPTCVNQYLIHCKNPIRNPLELQHSGQDTTSCINVESKSYDQDCSGYEETHCAGKGGIGDVQNTKNKTKLTLIASQTVENKKENCTCDKNINIDSAMNSETNEKLVCVDHCDKTIKGDQYKHDSGDKYTEDEVGIRNLSEIPLYEKYKSICGTVEDYLEQGKDNGYFESYLIPEKFFKRFWVMDIVTGESKNTCCFTKRYGRHIEGSAIIQMNTQDERQLSYYKKDRVYNDAIHEDVRSKKLRFFSPREIANIMCFPKSFGLPPHMSSIQCYRVLGNSLNVHVVSILIRLMTMGEIS